jgi:hypothetical protein
LFVTAFAWAGGLEFDKDNSTKLIASFHEKHLKRTKNLQLPKRQWPYQLQPPQPSLMLRRWQRPPGRRRLLQARTNLATVLIEVIALSLKK